MRTHIKRILKISGICLGSLILLLFLLPELFPGYFSVKIKTWANKAIEGDLNFSKARLSLIRHFPSLTLSLYDFSVMGSKPFERDTLLSGSELAFGLNLSSIFKANVTVDKFFLDGALINIQVDSLGSANYNIYKSTPGTNADKDSGSASLKIEKIQVTDSRLVYIDRSLPMQIIAREFNYTGKGDLSMDIFDLASKLEIGEFDFSYGGRSYVIKKAVKAKLLTRINTNSLAFRFENNQLRINDFPVDFKGSFDFLKNGYALNLNFTSGKTTLHDLFTILPPGYLDWVDEIYMKGDAMVDTKISGSYIAETNTNPDIHFSLQVRNGYIDHKLAPEGISGLHLDLKASLPNLDADSMRVDIDSLGFKIGNDFLYAGWHSLGIDPMNVNTHLNTKLDIGKLDQALAISMFDARGMLNSSFTMNGVYSTGQNPARLRPDTIITSVPAFHLQTNITNGFFKYASLPKAISNIQLQLTGDGAGGDYQNTIISIRQINASIGNSLLKGNFNLGNLSTFPLKSNLSCNINLAEIADAVPLNTKLSGKLLVNINADGEYKPSEKVFPKVFATVQLDDGSLQTPYYPNPVTDIQIRATATDEKANGDDLLVKVEPLAFTFEGKPFMINASLSNFNSLMYDITAKGIIDIGKIYRVFSQNGMDASGYIEADLSLKGSQADAKAGRYNRLSNNGTLKLKDARLSYDAYPKPFLIESASFSFNNDKILMENMLANYGSNNLRLDGYVFNVIDYVLKEGILKGKLNIQSNRILVDEFMAFAGAPVPGTGIDTTTANGVVILPSGLSVALEANAREVVYNDLLIRDLQGTVLLDSNKLKLKETTLGIAGAVVRMDASYETINPQKAIFKFALKADSFDIQRAYREVKLFHDLATSASKTKGMVSIDYHLQGFLNADMMPDYPTLTGGGILKLENIQVNGLKLFSSMSKASGKDSLNNPNLKQVHIKSSIANNVIKIERVKMKIFGFRPRFEGQTSFDGRINFKARLGLPPFGIIGIPMRITGTSSNPIVQMKKGTDEDLSASKEDETE